MSEDLGIETEDTPAKLTIDTTEIESVRERIADKESEICKKTSMVYLKSGCSFLVNTPYRKMIMIWEQDEMAKVEASIKSREGY